MDSTAKTSRSGQAENVLTALPHPTSKFTYFAAILFLIFCTQPATRVLTATTSDSQTDTVAVAFQALAYAMILLAFSAEWKALIRQTLSRRIFWILVLNAVALVSALWSDLPGLTFRRAILLFVNTAIAVGFTTRFSFDRQMKLLAYVFVGVLWCSLIAVLFVPAYGVMGLGYDSSLQGTWRGIWEHKNILGRYCALASLIFIFRYFTTRKTVWLLNTVLALVLLLGSQSKTALLVLLLVLAAISTFRIGVKRPKATIAFLAASTGWLIWYISQHLYELVDYLGRNMSLTGRIPLWFAGISLGLRRNPWLGYGFNDFWRGREGDSLLVWRFVRWPAPNIHNGFLDLWLVLGFVGLSVFLICHAITVVRALRWQMKQPSLRTLWYVTFLTYFTLENFAESVAVNYSSLMWILYVSVAYQVYEVVLLKQGSPDSRNDAQRQRPSFASDKVRNIGKTGIGNTSPELMG